MKITTFLLDEKNPPESYSIIKQKSRWRFYIDMWLGSSKPYKTKKDCIEDAWLHYSLFSEDN